MQEKMKKELGDTTTYKGYELFHDSSYFGMVACRKKGSRNFDETAHFKTIDEAKEYVDELITIEKNKVLANIYLSEKEDLRSYKIKLSKMPINSSNIEGSINTGFSFEGENVVGEEYVCDIENKNLIYSQNSTINGNIFHGLQCNFEGNEEKHKEIQNLCSKVADLIIKIHKLNNE